MERQRRKTLAECLMSSEPGSSNATSTSLLDRVRNADDGAWRRLVELYGPLIFSWGRRHQLSDEDAADVMQEVFAAVARSVQHFETQPRRGRFRGWLWTITRNKIRDHFRRTRNEVQARGGDTAWNELAAWPEEWSDDASIVSRQEVRLLFDRALELIREEFQPQTWQAFWKSVVEGEATDVIARELRLSANGVRQAKSRVLRRLRAELGDDEPPRHG